ncbi:hypothetical protein N9B54_01710 [Mariniblastus sp.]|nr:hypothetical protein [Mariniblastus sp.]
MPLWIKIPLVESPMNLQEFFTQYQDSDKQAVSVNDTFVINFGKPGGTSFNIDPEVISLFLSYLIKNHDDCRSAIVEHPLFSAANYTQYQEKPYRALYRLAGEENALNTIKSLGGSQTNQLTKVISKIICCLGDISYGSIEENTHFDKKAVTKALKNMPEDLRMLAQRKIPNRQDVFDTRKLFENWLTKKGFAERTIKSYCVSTMNKVDSIAFSENDEKSIYDIRMPVTLARLIDKLRGNSEWQQINRDGNGMYEAGVKKYKDFLDDLATFQLSRPLAKPLLLLAGISGTGKTRFVRKQASEFDSGLSNFCLVPVRPDWHEPTDLLGHVTRLTGKAQYISTDLIKFVVRAWGVVAPNASAAGCGELDLDAIPYWLCLDEMNLAPVEQYFADYLSVLESREYTSEGYKCDALIGKDILQNLAEEDVHLRKNLGAKDDSLWEYFLANGIPLPPNLIVAGTVNMDETTHGFSRKVIDRAITLDFGEFYPNDYGEFFNPTIKPVTLSWSSLTHASKDMLAGTWDTDGAKSIAFLERANSILRGTPFELAYRALNELLIQVACIAPASEHELQAVWDDFFITKVLPRIEGDEDKLRSYTDGCQGNVLDDLDALLSNDLQKIWSDGRKDFFRVSVSPDKDLKISCRSRAKMQWMRNRLEANTFTSFWP